MSEAMQEQGREHIEAQGVSTLGQAGRDPFEDFGETDSLAVYVGSQFGQDSPTLFGVDRVPNGAFAVAVGARCIENPDARIAGGGEQRLDLPSFGLAVSIGDAIGHSPLHAAQGQSTRIARTQPLPGRNTQAYQAVHPPSTTRL